MHTMRSGIYSRGTLPAHRLPTHNLPPAAGGTRCCLQSIHMIPAGAHHVRRRPDGRPSRPRRAPQLAGVGCSSLQLLGGALNGSHPLKAFQAAAAAAAQTSSLTCAHPDLCSPWHALLTACLPCRLPPCSPLMWSRSWSRRRRCWRQSWGRPSRRQTMSKSRRAMCSSW